MFHNASLVLNPEIHISHLLGHKIFTAFKVASNLQENTHNIIYKDYSFKYVHSKNKKKFMNRNEVKGYSKSIHNYFIGWMLMKRHVSAYSEAIIRFYKVLRD